jgi:membrane protein DedA with SNARE-associated domain
LRARKNGGFSPYTKFTYYRPKGPAKRRDTIQILRHCGAAMTLPEISHLISAYGGWIVAAFIALESMGVPFPGETVLIAAAVHAGTTHEVNIWSVIVAAIMGGIAGNMAGYLIGREFGYRLLLRYGRYLRLTDSRIKIGQYLFMRYGSKVVFVARFVALLRSVAALLAGANYMPLPKFVYASVAGAVAWATVVGLGAYYLGAQWKKLAGPVGLSLGVLGVIIIVALVVLLARRERQLATEAETAFPGPLRQVRTRRRR